jgi:hypothetical protein
MERTEAIYWFLAGASAFHAFTHIFYWASGVLPLDVKWFTVTSSLNQIELWVSVALAILFITLAKREKKKRS